MPSQLKAQQFTATRVIYFLAIVVVVFFARSIYTTPPEMHDARKKWEVANDIAATHDPALLLASEHHSSRWGVIIPTVIALKINGNNLITYYSLCLIFYAVFFAMMMNFARRDITPKLWGVFAILLFYEPMFFRASTQLQPFVFGVVYLSTALWSLARYLQNSNPVWLITSALFSFFAYGTKETYLLFVAGLCLLLFWKSSLKATIWFCLMLVLLFILETLIFNSLSENLTFGRIEFLSASKHLDKMPGREMHGIVDYIFRRWVLLPPLDKLISVLSAIVIVYLTLTRSLGKLHPVTLGIVLMAVCYSVLMTLFPLSIDPLIPIQPLKVKYLTPLMPFGVFVVVLGLSDCISNRILKNRKFVLVGVNAIAIAFLAWSVVFESPFKYQFRHKQYPEKDAMLWKYDDLNRALHAGFGVCSRKSIPIIKVQNMIRNYMNHEGLISKIKISNVGKIKVLHLKDFGPENLAGYFHHTDFEQLIPLEDCDKGR